MCVCVGSKYTSPSTILLQLVIMVNQLEKDGDGPYTRALHVDWERLPGHGTFLASQKVKNGIYYSRTLIFSLRQQSYEFNRTFNTS